MTSCLQEVFLYDELIKSTENHKPLDVIERAFNLGKGEGIIFSTHYAGHLLQSLGMLNELAGEQHGE